MKRLAKDNMTKKSTQCKTCNMTTEVQDFLNELHKQLVGFREMARNLEEVYDIHISDTSLGNHFKNHFMSPEDIVTAPITKNNTPKGYTPGFELKEDGTGIVTSKPQIGNKLITDFKDILLEMGVDPEKFIVEGSAGMSKWEQRSFNKKTDEFEVVWLSAYKVKVREKTSVTTGDTLQISDRDGYPLLYEVADRLASDGQLEEAYKKPRLGHTNDEQTTVVVFADPQVGKVGSRGGSAELTERVAQKYSKLEDYISRMNSSSAVFMDPGDIIEGFENTAQQMTTNDLSLMDQIDLAHTFELEFIDLLSKTHERVDAMSVPSNHAAWRKGKDYLGKPGDDWGLHIMKQVEKAYDRYNTDHNVGFHYANEWQKSLVVDIQGYGLGLVHGDNVNKPEALPQWWANQCHGGGPMALADLMVSGHYHTLRIQPTGRNALTGNQKWWVGAPTMDNGSDWYANGMGGGDSDAGLLVFTINKGLGFNLANLEIL